MIKKDGLASFYFFLTLLFGCALAEAGEEAREFVPHSSVATEQDVGINARTHFKILIPPGGYVKLNNEINLTPRITQSPRVGSGSPPYGYANETPASLACNYNLTPSVAGCSPINNSSLTNPAGGSKAIAVVDAYHYANAASDLTKFSNQFGLPAAKLQVVYASGTRAPPSDPLGWEVESALDLQWAHAMAPNATLYLVEAKSNKITDLLLAVDRATALVSAAGGGEVSMSWGSAEFSTELSYDTHFNGSGVVYFASSGDSAGTSWPCVSSNVVCVGGTTIRRNPSSGNVLAEVSWSAGGGGVSSYVTRPNYQNGVPGTSSMRSVPDVASAADPITGGWVYYTASNSSFVGWMIVGGTSWSAPSFAAMVNQSGSFLPSTNDELTRIYANGASYRDINSGWCGYYGGVNASAGWDICTGLGVNNTPVTGK